MIVTDQQRLRMWAGGGPPASISDAMNLLNSLGYVVGIDGCITVEGRKVRLQIQRGALVALVDGSVFPWDLFRRVLQPNKVPS